MIYTIKQMGNFHQQLAVANKYEQFIAEYICNKYHYIYISACTNADYDLHLSSTTRGDVTIEVKNDIQAKTNFFFEVECNGHKSGISSTKSDFFIYITPQFDCAYIFKTSVLKEVLPQLIETYDARKLNNCGDGGRATGIIVPIDLMAQYAGRIIYNIPNYYN